MYYNTNKLNKEMLIAAEQITARQDKRILELFASQPNDLIDSHTIEYAVGYPRSSVVRSLNTLMRASLIDKTEKLAIGKYGKPVHLYELAKSPAKQLSLPI